jgi:mono/diheme cytochrome c family protein
MWFLPETGGGILIALIAILHVFVSHFAVGGGLYLIYAEKKGLRESSEQILEFTKKHARFFLLVTVVFGSITGVGIWFIIALVNPAATSFLIHTFVFGWAAEWVFFFVEIMAAFIYFYMFGRMDSATHLKIGWVYFISAWMSLFLINGIIGFMLTPGAWLENPDFWVGFFNPSFFPSLFFRTFIAIFLAGIYGCFSAAFVKDRATRETMTRFSGKWSLIALLGTIPSGFWYLAILPEQAKNLVLGKSPTIVTMMEWGVISLLALLIIILLTAMYRPSLNSKWVAATLMLAGLVYFGSFEWTREAARRPYAINELIYSNMIFKDQVDEISSQGFLTSARWVQTRELSADNLIRAGEEIFIHQCYACHTIDGINNDIVSRTATMSYGALRSYIGKIHQMRYFMPPFVGTEEEVDALAAYIAGGLHGKEIVAVKKEDSGVRLFEENCAACHDSADLAPSLDGNSQEELAGLLARLDEISEEMVPFAGSEEEFKMLSGYLFSLNNETGSQADTGETDGAELFDINCSACHAAEDLAVAVSEWSPEEFRSVLDKLETLSEEMAPYEGTAGEKDALTEYMEKLKGEL